MASGDPNSKPADRERVDEDTESTVVSMLHPFLESTLTNGKFKQDPFLASNMTPRGLPLAVLQAWPALMPPPPATTLVKALRLCQGIVVDEESGLVQLPTSTQRTKIILRDIPQTTTEEVPALLYAALLDERISLSFVGTYGPIVLGVI